MPDPTVTENMCRERHTHLEHQFADMHRDVREIKKMMVGNGELGLCGKMNILWGVTAFLTVAVVTRLIVWLAEFLPRG